MKRSVVNSGFLSQPKEKPTLVVGCGGLLRSGRQSVTKPN